MTEHITRSKTLRDRLNQTVPAHIQPPSARELLTSASELEQPDTLRAQKYGTSMAEERRTGGAQPLAYNLQHTPDRENPTQNREGREPEPFNEDGIVYFTKAMADEDAGMLARSKAAADEYAARYASAKTLSKPSKARPPYLGRRYPAMGNDYFSSLPAETKKQIYELLIPASQVIRLTTKRTGVGVLPTQELLAPSMYVGNQHRDVIKPLWLSNTFFDTFDLSTRRPTRTRLEYGLVHSSIHKISNPHAHFRWSSSAGFSTDDPPLYLTVHIQRFEEATLWSFSRWVAIWCEEDICFRRRVIPSYEYIHSTDHDLFDGDDVIALFKAMRRFGLQLGVEGVTGAETVQRRTWEWLRDRVRGGAEEELDILKVRVVINVRRRKVFAIHGIKYERAKELDTMEFYDG